MIQRSCLLFQYWHHVEVEYIANVSEEHNASIFRVKESRVRMMSCYGRVRPRIGHECRGIALLFLEFQP
jgi:hypothetical protein